MGLLIPDSDLGFDNTVRSYVKRNTYTGNIKNFIKLLNSLKNVEHTVKKFHRRVFLYGDILGKMIKKHKSPWNVLNSVLSEVKGMYLVIL